MLKYFLTCLLLCSSTGIFAFTSTSAAPNAHFIPQTQQVGFNTTAPNSTETVVFTYETNAQIQCPDGYALISVQTTPQEMEKVKVFRQCNGFNVSLYAHVWCKNAEEDHDAVKKMPKGTFICQKLTNKWVSAK